MGMPYTPSPRLGANDPPLPDGPASNVAFFRELLDARRHLRGATWAHLTWSGRFEARGTAAAPALTIGAIEALTLRDAAGVWRPYFSLTETALGLAQVEGAPASLPPNTWHYVYAHDAGGTGTPQWQVSTIAPAASRAWKDVAGLALYRYLACFVTDDTGAPVPVVAHRGRYTYARTVSGAITSAAAAVPTLLSLAARVPPHSRAITANVTLTGTAWFRPVGDAGSTNVSRTDHALALDAAQRIEWSDGGGGSISVDVRTFEE